MRAHFIAATPLPWLPTPIVGRARELAVAAHHYAVAKRGYANVILVAGEAGIGKTRLLDEVARYASRDGAVVLRGGSSEVDGMPPFLPFLEALGHHIQHTPLEQVSEQLDGIAPLLASVLPEVTIRLGPQPEPLILLAEQARLRFFEAVGLFLENIGEPHGLVLILDDLHWADTASLDLLCHMMRRHVNAHVLVLGAYRDSEVEQRPALARTITELSRQRVLTRVSLNPLAHDEMILLAHSTLGSPLSPSAGLLLSTQSEGNPFFAEELLHCWIEEGALIQENQQWMIVESLTHTMPPSIAGALRQRFTRLSPICIDHLRVAAIIGRTFDLSLLATVEGQESEVVEESLLEAVRAQLIRVDQSGRCTFSHDNIRKCLYAEASTSRRKRLHGVIGQILEIRYQQERIMSMPQRAELTFHFTHSNDPVRAITYAQSAAEEALHTYAAEDAIRYYRVALDLVHAEDRRRGDLLLGLGEAALLAGKEQEAEIAYAAAQRWLSEREEPEARLAQAAHGLGRALWRQEKREEARAALERALALLGQRRCAEVAEVLLDLAVLLIIYIGQHEEGNLYVQQALDIAVELGDARLEAMAHRIALGNLTFRGRDLPLVTQYLEQTLLQLEQSGDLEQIGECCLYLCSGYYWLSEIGRAHTISRRRIELLRFAQQSYQLWSVYSWHMLLLTVQGKWREAQQMYEQARPVVDHIASPISSVFLCQWHGFLAYQQEDFLLAERELLEAQAAQPWQVCLGEMMFTLGLLGCVQAALGKEEEARTYMARVEARLALLPEGSLPTAPLLICLALTAAMLGKREQAIRLYPRLHEFHGQYYWFLVDRVLGLLAMLDGEWETAMTHLAEAEATARAEGLLPELARTLHGQAEVELARGKQENALHAEELLTQAQTLYEQLGMTASMQRVHGSLQELELPSSVPPSRPSLPANLTKREVEVLNLLAQGKRNRQIAQVLGLSEQTVTNHVTHIFNKIGCDNRSEATAFAIRHGLA